ncbi:hypothetical protein MOMA_06981 [Moraxella macacae 0408225]|uniref:Uncharacterized protein n=1 Tax=Moraxella macacae 0408225 TaxID=1230338 RepID=L2F673_9GAMM|nr:DUF1315 family protein [Moraxella macacae]ELA08286.1 hypothetical protein MOMA_06981 [Moraxella macacae 0408225]
MDKQQILDALTPQIIEKFRTAIQLDKWENGVRLTDKQRHTCMQAVMIWEHEYLPINERIGYIHRPKKESEDCDIGHDQHYPHVAVRDFDTEQPIQFRNW